MNPYKEGSEILPIDLNAFMLEGTGERKNPIWVLKKAEKAKGLHIFVSPLSRHLEHEGKIEDAKERGKVGASATRRMQMTYRPSFRLFFLFSPLFIAFSAFVSRPVWHKQSFSSSFSLASSHCEENLIAVFFQWFRHGSRKQSLVSLQKSSLVNHDQASFSLSLGFRPVTAFLSRPTPRVKPVIRTAEEAGSETLVVMGASRARLDPVFKPIC